MTAKKRAIVLHSGGIDSTVAAAVARDGGYELNLLHFDYGQRTEHRERTSFAAIARAFDAKGREIADVQFLQMVGHSSLTDYKMPVPEGTSGGIPTTYVPFRNGIFLSLAAAWAEALKAEAIFVGVMEEDGPGYPDTTEDFVNKMQQAIDSGTKPESKIEIKAPLVHMSKTEVVKLGAKLLVPFGMTWSCYQDQDIACGVCQSCIMRKKAFEEAGITDPIRYRK